MCALCTSDSTTVATIISYSNKTGGRRDVEDYDNPAMKTLGPGLVALYAALLSSVVLAQRRLPQHRELSSESAVEESEPRVLYGESQENVDASDDDDGVVDEITTAMPGLSEKINLVHHAGRISLDSSKRNNIFYWHFAAASDAATAPLVIWLNGGPGCTSMQGLFLGVSPFQIGKDMTLSINKHSWHHTANVLFIDQPVGTGMSYTRGNDYRTDEETVAKDFHTVLLSFFKRHPEYYTPTKDRSSSQVMTTRDLYIFGESHAGRFIPEFSDFIVKQNKLANKEGDVRIQLKGIGIGNGWVHPLIQYDYSDFAHGLGLLTFGQVRSLKAEFAECRNALLSGTFLSPACFQNMNSILDGLKNTRTMGSSKTLNFYDVRQYVASVSGYPSSRQYIGEYLNQLPVRKLLHANVDPNFTFRDCSDQVFDGLRSFDGVSTLEMVQRLLQSGTRVLFYNGQWDMMCHHYGTEKLLLHLNWNGSEAYQEAKKYTWSVAGRTEPAGFAQQGGNLTYLVIAGAGHMVPMDVPDVAAEMMKRFVRMEPFDDSPQLVKSVATNSSNYETAQCTAVDGAAAMGLGGGAASGDNLTWLWVVVVVVVVGSLLVFCVMILCRRNGLKPRKARHSEHSVIDQDSDDDDEDRHGMVEADVVAKRSSSIQNRDDDDKDADSGDELQEVSIRSRN